MIDKQSIKPFSDAEMAASEKHPSSADELGCFVDRLHIAIKGRSARSFARDAGVSETVFRKYASGASEPTRPALVAMAHAAGVSTGWLAAGESESQPVRLDEASLAQAIGLVQGLMAGRGALSDGDFAHALAQFYQVCSDPHGANALAGTVVEMSQFIARRAKQGS